MKDVIVAGRYARALFLVTEKRGETSRALEDVKALVGVIGPDGTVGKALASPRLRLSDKREAVKGVLEGRVARVSQLFVDLLLRKRRLHELPEIAVQFEALVERALGLKRAHVVSAVPLETTEVERLHAALERYTRNQIKLTREVDPALLGGSLVRIGDRVIDRSVRTLLESIEMQLSEVVV